MKDCVNVLMDEMDLAKSTYGLYEQKTSSELKAVSDYCTNDLLEDNMHVRVGWCTKHTKKEKWK